MNTQEQIYKQRLEAVLDVVRRYLPPDGVSAHDAMGKIIELVDPWPEPQSSPDAEQASRDAQDAARYRQLRRGQQWSVIDGIGNTLRGEHLDAAIDATTNQPKKGGKP
jgi:hypothetical protein